ncbi:hypothetical protein L1887_07829 [Cichorium endivia]|nr:hypothetical protein L1887_07829 [Cichorium endivia]
MNAILVLVNLTLLLVLNIALLTCKTQGFEEMAWRQTPLLNRNLLSLISSNSNTSIARFSSKASPYPVKVGIPEFLNGIGNGVETYAEKLESEFGDLQNLLVARSMKLKKLNVGGDPKVCKHRKLILKYAHKYRLGLWRPRIEPPKSQ